MNCALDSLFAPDTVVSGANNGFSDMPRLRCFVVGSLCGGTEMYVNVTTEYSQRSSGTIVRWSLREDHTAKSNPRSNLTCSL
jgi:hypothetical protein